MNCFIKKQHTSGYNSIPDDTTSTDDDDDTTSIHRSKRLFAFVTGMMMLVVAGGAVLLRDGSLYTTTTAKDLVVGTPPVYDPNHDYCFFDAYIEQHCWYPTRDYHNGNWKLLNIGGNDSCGPECPAPPPPPPPPVYDPSHDYCFTDNDNALKYCWYPTDNLPVGNWEGEGGHGYNDCGDLCTDVADDDDGPCLPPTDTFGGVSQINSWYGLNDPFQTCYQLGDEDKYCWSNSFYHGGPWIPIHGTNRGWYQCSPNPRKGGWHAIEQKNMRYVNPPPQNGDPYTCGLSIGGVGGAPCQEMYQDFRPAYDQNIF